MAQEIEVPECRNCHEPGGDLISPCHCSGSIKVSRSFVLLSYSLKSGYTVNVWTHGVLLVLIQQASTYAMCARQNTGLIPEVSWLFTNTRLRKKGGANSQFKSNTMFILLSIRDVSVVILAIGAVCTHS